MEINVLELKAISVFCKAKGKKSKAEGSDKDED
jgi:hypothetical protein